MDQAGAKRKNIWNMVECPSVNVKEHAGTFMMKLDMSQTIIRANTYLDPYNFETTWPSVLLNFYQLSNKNNYPESDKHCH